MSNDRRERILKGSTTFNQNAYGNDFSLLLLELSYHCIPGSGAKVLVLPVEFSHWMNSKIILDESVQRGHSTCKLHHQPYSIFYLKQGLTKLKGPH